MGDVTEARERIRWERAAKRVRVYLGGEVVVDTTEPVLVWELPYYPTYFFPVGDVEAELLEDGATRRSSAPLGEGRSFTVKAGGKEVPGAAVRYVDSPVEELRGLVRLEWDAMDAWFEEDEEVFTHPRDPYKRIDVLASSRDVRVDVGGETVAESSRPTLLFETGLPVRYYLPKPHVRMELLVPSDTVTHCAYKGRAEHWSVHAGDATEEDIAWSYPAPLAEGQKVAGLVCFYNEKVDIDVDGVRQERPRTHFK